MIDLMSIIFIMSVAFFVVNRINQAIKPKENEPYEQSI